MAAPSKPDEPQTVEPSGTVARLGVAPSDGTSDLEVLAEPQQAAAAPAPGAAGTGEAERVLPSIPVGAEGDAWFRAEPNLASKRPDFKQAARGVAFLDTATGVLVWQGGTVRLDLGRATVAEILTAVYAVAPASVERTLRAVVQEVQAGGPRDLASLKALAAGHVQQRLNREGYKARVRGKTRVRAERTVKDAKGKPVIGADGKPVRAWSPSLAKAGKQHISSGAGRLRPVVDDAAANGGKITFTVRTRKGSFKHDAGRRADSPGVRRNVVQRHDGTEERAYADNRGGPGSGEEGFDGAAFKALVDAAGGDVAAAVQKWLVDTDKIKPGTQIVVLEIRAWMPQP